MKKTKIILTLFVQLCFPILVLSQIKQGEILIKGAVGLGVTSTKDNGYCIAGIIDSMGLGGVYVAKLDSNASIQWSKAIGGGYPYSDAGFSVIQTNDKGYAIAGSTSSFSTNHYDNVYVIKLDSSGNLKWTQTIGGNNYEYGYSMVQAVDGGYVITGQENEYFPGGVYVIKLDTGGNLQWTKSIGGSDGDLGESIVNTSDKGYAIAGITKSFGTAASNSGGNMYIIKIDSIGNLQWTRTIGGKIDDEATSIAQSKNNDYYITGNTHSYGDTVNGDVYVAKLDSAGNLKWAEAIGGSEMDYSSSITSTYDGGCALAGFTNSFGDTVNGSIYIIRLDTSGIIAWTRIIGSGVTLEESIVQTHDSGFAITGRSSLNNSQFHFFKLDKNGNSCVNYDSGGVVTIGGIVDSGGLVSSGGTTIRGGTINNAGSVETIQCIITSTNNLPTQTTNDLLIYPNPAKDKITIESSFEWANAKIFDVTGRLMLEQKMKSEDEINISKLGSGVYLLQIEGENKVITNKVIKL